MFLICALERGSGSCIFGDDGVPLLAKLMHTRKLQVATIVGMSFVNMNSLLDYRRAGAYDAPMPPHATFGWLVLSLMPYHFVAVA